MSVFKDGRHKKTIVTRRLRFWEARNVKKGGELMGVDMVSVEQKVVVMNRQIINSIYFPVSFLTRAIPRFLNQLADTNIVTLLKTDN